MPTKKRKGSNKKTPASKKTKSPLNMNDTKDAKCWVVYDADCNFPIENLPYGAFKPNADSLPRCGVAIGDQVCNPLC